MENNYFIDLFNVNVSDKIEQKNGLSYVSWPYAWAEVKKRFPDATYTVYENKDGWFYHTDGKTCWVKTGLTVNGIEHIEMLPVMDFKNRSISADAVTSTDVNKAIQRSLTKAAARHGLGLYVYAGEDLPESEQKPEGDTKKPETKNPVVKAYIAKQISIMKEMFEIPDTAEMNKKFTAMRNALIKGGVIPDKSSDEQTLQEAEAMIEAIYANFKPSGDAV